MQLQLHHDRLTIEMDAPYFDDPAPTDPIGTTWALWNYEVVELFLVGDDGRYC